MRSAIVEDGVVVNIIVGSTEGSINAPNKVGIGWRYDGSGWIEPEPDPVPDELWEALRAERDSLIAATDWMVKRHAEELALGIATTLTPGQYTDLLTYRQALRDLPESTADPAAPVWPANPLE